jgi:hypothetical protein
VRTIERTDLRADVPSISLALPFHATRSAQPVSTCLNAHKRHVSALQARPAPFPITLLWKHPEFQSGAGTAEDTGLPTDSVDVVTAAQAFHWFDVEKASR